MKRSRFSEEEIIGVLKEAEATTVKATCAKRNISEATYYGWGKKYGGQDVNSGRRRQTLEEAQTGVKKFGNDQIKEKPHQKRGKLEKRDERQKTKRYGTYHMG